MTAVPAGRGRWRLTLHRRQFSPADTFDDTMLAEIITARSRQLQHDLNKPAELRFTLDGRDPACTLVEELATDVMAWRFDEQSGRDVCVFRGCVDQSEDTLSEQADSVNFVAHDYSEMLTRRLVTDDTLTYSQQDQDVIVTALVEMSKAMQSSGGAAATVVSASVDIPTGTVTPQPNRVSFGAGSYLPLEVVTVDPSGAGRLASGQLRDRTYRGNQQIGTAISDMAAVINGFDYDVIPGAQTGTNVDQLRVFYPYQGVETDRPALVYGSTVNNLTRSVNASSYGNYWRVVGNNQSSSETDPQTFSERWDGDVNDVTRVPTGLWMSTNQGAASASTDVTTQSTLNASTEGSLTQAAAVVPTYTVGLAPGAYSWGFPNMGDELPLVIHFGRLDVDTRVRVVGFLWDIQDNDFEAVTLTVGTPVITFFEMLRRLNTSLDALARR